MSNAAIVAAWFRDKIATGDIARYTPAYNQASAAVPALIAALDAAGPALKAEVEAPAVHPTPDSPAPEAVSAIPPQTPA